MADSIEDLKRKLKRKREKESPKNYLSTGSTLLNLALSGRPDDGFSIGHYYLLAGASGSGKTFISLTSLAEASINPAFAGHRLIFDCPEDGALMDMKKFFPSLSKRIEVPEPSATVEGFYYNLDDALSGDKPMVYVLDSMDALVSEDDEEKFQAKKKAARGGKDESGSYGTAKAKANSSNLNHVVSKLKKTGSILIIISQVRDNISFTAKFKPKVRSGGLALTFYATCECWFSVKEKIKKTVRGKPETVGMWMQVKIQKNRQTGTEPAVDIPFFISHGIDDTGSCVDFLIERGHWKGNEASVKAPEFAYDGKREGLVRDIEEAGRESELRALAASIWTEIIEACQVKRKNRYAE